VVLDQPRPNRYRPSAKKNGFRKARMPSTATLTRTRMSRSSTRTRTGASYPRRPQFFHMVWTTGTRTLREACTPKG
jgi:hypothetical protein